MAHLFLIFSHRLTPEQKEDACRSLGVDHFFTLPDDLKRMWRQIPPELPVLDR